MNSFLLKFRFDSLLKKSNRNTTSRIAMVTLALCGSTGCDRFAGPALTTPQQLAEEAVAPAYQNWADSSHALFVEAQTQCQATDKLDIDRLRKAWRADALAWSRLQSMQPGPVTPVSVRVSYWPDKKDLVGHQVELWIQKALPTAAQLAEQSVTLQGLSALEFMLFDSRFAWGKATERERLCPRVSVVAERQQNLAQETLQLWQKEQGQGMRSPLPNARYATENEALAELLRANVGGLEVAHKKLVAALGEKYPQPYLAEYWRSDLSLPSARAVIEGSFSLWEAGLADAVEAKQPTLAEHISAAYDQLLAAPLLDEKGTPLLSLLKTADGRAQVGALTEQMKSLHMLYARDVSKALQISLGINAHDGD